MTQPIAFGATFQISSQNMNTQDQSALATLRDGRVVAVWKDFGSGGGDIKLQLLAGNGGKYGSEAIASAASAGLQSKPAVAALTGGGFAVAWETYASDSSGDVAYRTFSATGAATMAGDGSVAPAPNYQQDVALIGTASGGFLIGWNEGNTATSGLANSSAAMLRDFSAAGVGGTAFRVSGNWGGDYGPRLAASGNQIFAAWDDSGGPSQTQNGEDGIYSRLITGALPTGNFSDGGTRVDTGTFRESSMNPDVAITARGPVVVWDDVTTGTVGRDIYLSMGGTVARVNTTTAGDQADAAVTKLADGGFVVVWTDLNPVGGSDIRARAYSATGVATSADFLVTETGARTTGAQFAPDVTALLDGRFLVSWSDENAGQGINGRIFDPRTSGQIWSGAVWGEQYWGTAFADRISGNAGADSLFGMDGADSLNGGTGSDRIDGGLGFDTVSYAERTKAIQLNLAGKMGQQVKVGGVFEDVLSSVEGVLSGSGNDYLQGDGAANRLNGAGGNDTLNGSGGLDTLTGGAGGDVFVFSTGAGAPFGDAITDFAHGIDHIGLKGTAFAALGPTVTANELRFGTGAVDPDDRLIYNATSGKLLWDADANGSGAAIALFRVTPGTVLSAGDFLMLP